MVVVCGCRSGRARSGPLHYTGPISRGVVSDSTGLAYSTKLEGENVVVHGTSSHPGPQKPAVGEGSVHRLGSIPKNSHVEQQVREIENTQPQKDSASSLHGSRSGSDGRHSLPLAIGTTVPRYYDMEESVMTCSTQPALGEGSTPVFEYCLDEEEGEGEIEEGEGGKEEESLEDASAEIHIAEGMFEQKDKGQCKGRGQCQPS